MSNFQTHPKYKPSGIDGSTSLTTSWLGDIPEGWKVKRNLGLFSERNERVKHFAKDDFELLSVTIQKGVVRQLELAEEEQRKDSSNEDKGNYKWVRKSDIAYNKMRMWQGAAGESKYDGIVSPAYIILKPKTGVLPRYFHYFFRTEMFNEIAYQYGYGIADDQHSLRYWQFKTLYSLFPPPETQKQIADFLDEKTKVIDELVAKKEKLIGLLREKRAALITRAVTKGLDPNVQFKPSGVDWLGDIPEGWETSRIRFLVQTNPSKSEVSDLPNQPVSFLPMSHVSENGLLDLSEERDLNFIYTGFTYFRDGDVLLAKITPCFENGKGAFVLGLTNEIGFGSTEFHVFRPKRIDGEFLYYFFASDGFMKFGELNMRGTAGQKRVPDLFVKDFVIGIPPTKEQKQIADFLDTKTAKIDKAVALIESQIAKLKEYRSSLIYSAVTGKIRV